MIHSIRKYLLIRLMCGITLVIGLSTVANYFLNRTVINSYIDRWMSEMCLAAQTMLATSPVLPDPKQLQIALTQLYSFAPNSEPVQFQLWNEKGQLLVHSSLAPLTRFNSLDKNGYSNVKINNTEWRIFANYNSKTHLTLYLGERVSFRQALNYEITRSRLLSILLCYPILAMLVWMILGKALKSITRTAKEISQRAPNFLDPVDIHVVPSEIKPLIDELNKLFLRLRQGFEREKSFSANAAHELRTPLAALKTQAQVALKTTNADERDRILHKLISSVDRANHVVQQLLTLCRIVPETALHEMIKINLTQLTAEVIANIAPIALEKNIEIEFIRSEKQYYITGFVTAISILLRNLIDNAIRYTPSDGAIRVEIVSSPEFITFSVIDNGPGIPAELRSQVFERFYRVLGTKSPGSGLGLAIVQQIAAIHHAIVTLGSPCSGKGLEVIVDFPRA